MSAGTTLSAGSVFVSIRANMGPIKKELAALEKQIGVMGKKLSANLQVNARSQKMTGSLSAATSAATALKTGFNNLNKAVAATSRNFAVAAVGARGLSKNFRTLAASMGVTANNINSVSSRAVRGMRQIGNSTTTATKKVGLLGRAFSGLSGKVDLTGLNRQLYVASRSLQRAGNSLLLFGGAAIGGIGLATRKFIDFDEELIRTKLILSDITDEEFTALEKKARQLGATTSFTAGQVAAGIRELAQGGQNAQEILASIAPALNLARIGDIGIDQASKQLVRISNAFGLIPQQVQGLADTLAKASVSSSTNAAELAQGFSFVAGAAANAGQSVEDTATLLAALSDNYQVAGRGGRGLNQVFTVLAKKSKKIQEAFGVDVKDAAGNYRSVAAILFDIEDSLKGIGKVEQDKLLTDVFSTRALRAVRAIFASRDSFDQLNKTIKDSEGFAQNFSDTLEAGLGGTFRRLRSVLEEVGITLITALQPAMRSFLKDVISAATSASSWIKQNRELVTWLAKAAVAVTALGVGLKILGGLVSVILIPMNILNGALVVLGGLGSAIGALGAPFVALSAVIAVSTVSILDSLGLWEKTVEKLSEVFGSMYESVYGYIKSLVGDSAKLLAKGEIVAAAKVLAARLKLEFKKALISIKQIGIKAINSYRKAWDSTLAPTKDFIKSTGLFENTPLALIPSSIKAYDALIDKKKEYNGISAINGSLVSDDMRTDNNIAALEAEKEAAIKEYEELRAEVEKPIKQKELAGVFSEYYEKVQGAISSIKGFAAAQRDALVSSVPAFLIDPFGAVGGAFSDIADDFSSKIQSSAESLRNALLGVPLSPELQKFADQLQKLKEGRAETLRKRAFDTLKESDPAAAALQAQTRINELTKKLEMVTKSRLAIEETIGKEAKGLLGTWSEEVNKKLAGQEIELTKALYAAQDDLASIGPSKMTEAATIGFWGSQNPLEMLGATTLKTDQQLLKVAQDQRKYLKTIAESGFLARSGR